ncbi:AAA ATPase-like protein [Kribbella sp. VKM Ac-2527]|uniref:AAA ATPase-like protein n=1 Tax=Kribbella caucasensis TaxID=2512215 RepID=A0A4R6KNQ8_9ACTN|nr:LuxR family transcriptional regulator [Kribbella sp. VKM Ac-2527]TDO54276.1 AAA ATPase-like protein [Kribbella sp. VKM Ac-2527]
MAGLQVGRGVEAAALRGLIADMPERSAAVVVRGEAGIGKTLLVRSVLDEHSGSGVRILRGACAPMSGATAYSGLGATVTAALSQSTASGQFPSAAAARAWSMQALAGVLDSDAAQGTVLLVEDVHWADWSTLDFLAHSTRNLPERRLLVLLTWRDETAHPDRLTWLAELLRCPAVIDMPLRRLTAEETSEQLSGLQPGCTAETIAAVYQRSAGNPYLSAELIRGDLTVPASLRAILLARLQGLSLAARTVVAATGTLARALDDDDLLAAVDGAADAVREACDSGLVIRDPAAGCTARHPVIAEVAYEQLLSSERRDLHARLAKHLAARVLTDASAAQLAEVAEQYRRASDRDATFTWALAAARVAEKEYAYTEAGHWYSVASSLWQPSDLADDRAPQRLVLAERAASLLGGAGQHAEALALLEEAVADGDGEMGTLEALLMRGRLRALADDLAGAIEDIERARRLVPTDDDRAVGRVCIAHAMLLSPYARSPEVARAARMALEHATRAGDIRTVGQARAMLGGVAADEGRIEDSLDEARAALTIARDLAEPEDLARAGVALTYAYGVRGDTDSVVAVANTIQSELRRLMADEHWLEGIVESNAVYNLYAAGRWDEALSRDDRGRPPSGPAFKDAQLALIHMARGNLQTAVELMRGQELLAVDDQPQFKRDYAQTEAQLRLLQQRPREALALSLDAAELSHDTEDELVSAGLLRVGLEAAVASQSPDGFDRLVALLRRAVSGDEAAALAAIVDGERSRIRGTPDSTPWLTAAQEWASLGRPYWEAQARLRAAEALLAHRGQPGSRGRATGELEAARQVAEQLGAAPLLGQIQVLAKVARIHLDDSVTEHHEQRAATTDPHPRLTERERQVLALVAAGRTNREIGATLYMSPKTASVHVTHILEKLGVQSRVQAAAEAIRLDLTGNPAPPA